MTATPRRFRLAPVACALVAAGLGSSAPLSAAPQGGTVVAGSASIGAQGATTTVVQQSERAIINWRDFSTRADEGVRFVQPSASSATLNRVTGSQASVLLGRLDANGQVILINPHGILIGQGARVDVGSLIASTSAIGDDDFMAGRLQFRPSGVAGTGIRNEGTITAAEGGLVALVAPHVRNDGVIEARLGRVQIGAADRFTIDLYGDGLISLSLDESNRGALRDAEGRPVDRLIDVGGAIRTDGGQTVLIAAADAGAVLDRAINLGGTVRADYAVERAGRIVLAGGPGAVDVAGRLAASGERGGAIDVTGGTLRIAAGAQVDAHGETAGGRVRVGGDWQGGGDLARATTTTVAAGATIDVRATGQGDAGVAVVWADGHTAFAGTIDARGGAAGGDGGRVEVSGKRTLDFAGEVELGAAAGRGGALLLDPETANLGATEVFLINRVLRTGATATVAATLDINVNGLIDGRGRASGGGLTLNAGRDINVNEFIVTNNGAITLLAGSGTLNFAAGKAAFAGSGPISVTTGGNLSLGNLYTTGSLSARSSGGMLTVAQGIDGLTGAVSLRAAQDLTVAQPIVNFLNGSALTLTSDAGNVVIDAQIDGRASNGVASGPVVVSAGNHILLNQSIVAEDGPITLTATGGTLTPAVGKGLFAGSGAISVTTGGNLASGIYGTTGALSLRSTGGTLTVATKLDETLGDVTLRGGTGVNVNQGIANLRNGSSLTVISDAGDINVNARIDAQDDSDPASVVTPVPGGAVTMTAANNVNFNETLVTFDGPVNVTATTGTVAFWNAGTNGSGNKKIIAGSAPISITTGGNFSTGTAPPAGLVFNVGAVGTNPASDFNFSLNLVAEALKPWVTLATTGTLSITSTGGSVSIDAPIPQTTGTLNISAGNDVIVNEKLVNAGTVGKPTNIVAGTACTVGTCTPTTQGRIVVNNAASENVVVNYTFGGVPGAVSVGDSPEIDTRAANLTMTAFGDVDINEAVASAATLSITSTQGTIYGTIGDSRNAGGSRPQHVFLSGGAGVGAPGQHFSVGSAGTVTATSGNGGVYMFVNGTSQLTVTAPSAIAGDIVISSSYGGMGTTANLAAGRDVDLRDSILVGALTASAGRDVLFETMNAGSIDITGAGRDVLFNYTGDASYASIWMTGQLRVGTPAARVGRDIRFLANSGVSLMDADSIPTTGPQPKLILAASGDVELRRLQTYGGVEITAGDDIVLNYDIGPVITNPVKFTTNKGVEYLQLTTGSVLGNTITMQGARSVGNVSITTHTLTAGKSITSTSGTVSIVATTQNVTAGAIGSMDEMLQLPIVAPAIVPGPAVNAPPPPAALNALAPLAPGGVAVGSASAPAGAEFGELVVIDPEKSVGGEFGEIVPTDEGSAGGRIAENQIEVPIDSPSQAADFGRSGPYSGRAASSGDRKCSDRPDGKCA